MKMLEELIEAEAEVTDFFRRLLVRASQGLPIDTSLRLMLNAMRDEANTMLKQLDECHVCKDTRPLIRGASGHMTCPGCGEV